MSSKRTYPAYMNAEEFRRQQRQLKEMVEGFVKAAQVHNIEKTLHRLDQLLDLLRIITEDLVEVITVIRNIKTEASIKPKKCRL